MSKSCVHSDDRLVIVSIVAGNKALYLTGEETVSINKALNQLLVGLFKDINEIEEKAIRTGQYKNMTTNDMHVIEAIGVSGAKNMSSVAKTLNVTTGTLTIAINSLVKKNYVERVRSEEDRRVVLVSLTPRGKKAFYHHKKFHDDMIEEVVSHLDETEQKVLEKTLNTLTEYFRNKQEAK
ncbi:MAG: MarR family transcriptional regulator [Lachnospiraceae bacterium]|nr:MarR family transcriptional regulator [Lachnospiraceae bacterium]